MLIPYKSLYNIRQNIVYRYSYLLGLLDLRGLKGVKACVISSYVVTSGLIG